MLDLAALVLPFVLAAPICPDNGRVVGDEPPPGAPWHRSYRAARREALRKGRPIFVYFTKTY